MSRLFGRALQIPRVQLRSMRFIGEPESYNTTDLSTTYIFLFYFFFKSPISDVLDPAPPWWPCPAPPVPVCPRSSPRQHRGPAAPAGTPGPRGEGTLEATSPSRTTQHGLQKAWQHGRQPADARTQHLRSARLLPVELSSKIWDLNRKMGVLDN